MKLLSPGLSVALLLWSVVLLAHAEEKPDVIRLAFTNAGASGKGESGGILLTAYLQGVLEQEFKAEGIRVEWSLVPGGTTTFEALSRKLVDFAGLGDVGAVSGWAAGHRHKVILALNRFGSSYIVVRSDSPVRTLEELKGKRLGTIRGLAGDLSLRRILESEGLGEKDFEIVNLKGHAAAVISALAAGEIDGHFMSQPFDLEARGKVKVIYHSRRIPDISGLGVFTVAEEFEQRYPAIVQRVVNTLLKTAAWIAEEQNRDAVFRLWAHADTERESLEKKWAGVALKDGLSPLMDDYFFAKLRQSADEAKRFAFVANEVGSAGRVEPKYLQAALAESHLEHYWPRFDAAGRIVAPAPPAPLNQP